MLTIYGELLKAARKAHITLDWSAYKDMVVGLPYNIPFVVKNARAQIKCPRCGSTKTARILYDMPAFSEDLVAKIDAGKIHIGGCCITGFDAKYYCNDCKKKFGEAAQIVNGEEIEIYSRFFVFIIAPRKYLSQNSEAKKYPNRIEYERVLSYFENMNDPRAAFKIQQIKQAIEKQKKGYQVEMDPAVTDFWSRYADYQKENYPGVLFLYNNEIKGANATWPRFNTIHSGLYMYHKTEFGVVDMTFEGCPERILEIEQLLKDTIGDYLANGFTVQKTGKSAAVRLVVPILDLHKSFDAQKELIKAGFEAIQTMSDTAKRFPPSTVAKILGRV